MSARALTFACLVLAFVAAGCEKASPRYRYATSAPPASAAPVTSQPSGGSAPVTTSSTPSTPRTPPPPPPPVAQAGPGGLSGPPARPLPAPTTTITVGAGPVIGRTARGDVFEHGRDWEASDLRALDPIDARYSHDGLVPSREIVAFYSRRQNGKLFLRLDLLDLRYGAELGGLDVVVLLSWGSGSGAVQPPLGIRETTAYPYGAAIVVEDASVYRVEDDNGVAVANSSLEVSFRSDLDMIEMGVDQAELRTLGWSGQPLVFQVLTARDGSGRIADGVLELNYLDRTLDQSVQEGWVADRRAAIAPIAVGNRAALTATYLSNLCFSDQTTTSEGFPTGLHRTLESHAAHGLPINLHLSGVLANAIGWAETSDPRQSGAALLARVAEFFDGNPDNGEGGFLPGTYVDNILPFFEGSANHRFVDMAQDVYRERLGISQPSPVFWIPERVARASTLDEIRANGFTHTVLDRTHLDTWFNEKDPGGGLHRINGVDCFVIDPTVDLFAHEDGGPQVTLRRQLLERALDPDAEQVVIFVADWEKYTGQNGSPDNPDVYDRTLTWLSQRPWIEVATLDDLAGRGWTPTDHGTHASLPIETHEWLRHATEKDYSNWYYGHALEESLAALRPVIRHGRPHARQIGDVHTPGTLFGDVWGAITAAPAGNLKALAEQAFASGLYRTAWHREDMHDLRRLANGDYVSPDVTYDRLSGFSFLLSIHTGEAATTAYAAGWAANPPANPQVMRHDTDLDGEDELLLADERMLLVFEEDGGRLVAGFTRDTNGEGYQVLGDPLAYPSNSPELGWEDDFVGAARNSVLKDVWLDGPARGYVNDASVASVSTTSVALSFTSSDGQLTKTITRTAPGQVEVRYDLDPSAGTLYTRAGLNPHLSALALSGQQGLVETDAAGVYTLAKTYAGRTVSVRVGYADAGHTARRNPTASDGTPASPRNTAFQHMLELSGDAPGFSFSLSFEAQ